MSIDKSKISLSGINVENVSVNRDTQNGEVADMIGWVKENYVQITQYMTQLAGNVPSIKGVNGTVDASKLAELQSFSEKLQSVDAELRAEILVDAIFAVVEDRRASLEARIVALENKLAGMNTTSTTGGI